MPPAWGSQKKKRDKSFVFRDEHVSLLRQLLRLAATTSQMLLV